jgi:hypothetical protein
VILVVAVLAIQGVFSFVLKYPDIAEAAMHTAWYFPMIAIVTWFMWRAVIPRLTSLEKPHEVMKLTISPSGFTVSSGDLEVRYAWNAVSEVLVRRNYVYVLSFGNAYYAFARAGFESAEIASRFWNELVSFVEPARVVWSANVKLSRGSRDSS